MSVHQPGELPDQSVFSANSFGKIPPKHNEPTNIMDEPTESTLPETIPQSNKVQQSEKVSIDNPKQSEIKSELVSPLNVNDGKLASGDSRANTTEIVSVSPEPKLCEIEKEVENLNISAEQTIPSVVVVKNKTESLTNLMAYTASSDSEGEEVCINITYCFCHCKFDVWKLGIT